MSESRPRLLDLFCGAGGCSVGYERAGFQVTGVDIVPQPRYPFAFVQADAIDFLSELLSVGPVSMQFDAIHASPPCQAHSTIAKQIRKLGKTKNEHLDFLPQTRDLLRAAGLPYVIENVPGAPLIDPVTICGSSLGLDLRRHRLFETNWPLMAPSCAHGWQTPRFRSLDSRRHNVRTTVPVHGSKQLASVVGVHGHLSYAGEMALRERAMDVDWMSPAELAQAIPPAYTELIGHQLMQEVEARVAA